MEQQQAAQCPSRRRRPSLNLYCEYGNLPKKLKVSHLTENPDKDDSDLCQVTLLVHCSQTNTTTISSCDTDHTDTLVCKCGSTPQTSNSLTTILLDSPVPIHTTVEEEVLCACELDGEGKIVIDVLTKSSDVPLEHHVVSVQSTTTKQVSEVSSVPLGGGKQHSPPQQEQVSDPDYDNRYEKVTELGSGTYGSVYLLNDRWSGKSVIGKFIQRSSIKRWVDEDCPMEVSMLYRLRGDPGVVTIHDALGDEDQVIIVMEKGTLKECDLFDLVSKYTKDGLDEPLAAHIFRQVVETVRRLHQNYRILHLDLKPENILVDTEFNTKLIDFGLATPFNGTPRPAFYGTELFCSPEACLEKGVSEPNRKYRCTGPETEVWALGVTLYCMLFMDHPFHHVEDICNPEVQVDFPRPIAKDLEMLLRGMLDRDLERRLTTDQILASSWIHRHAQPPPS